jgi:hypothetical protein
MPEMSSRVILKESLLRPIKLAFESGSRSSIGNKASKKQQGFISMDAHMAIHNLRLGIDSHPETCDKQPA